MTFMWSPLKFDPTTMYDYIDHVKRYCQAWGHANQGNKQLLTKGEIFYHWQYERVQQRVQMPTFKQLQMYYIEPNCV